MAEPQTPPAAVSSELLDALKSFPRHREVKHCGATFHAEPFDIDATCPACGQRVKVRAYSARPELEDVFDAVFAWLARGGDAMARRRIAELRDDLDEYGNCHSVLAQGLAVWFNGSQNRLTGAGNRLTGGRDIVTGAGNRLTGGRDIVTGAGNRLTGRSG